MLPGVQGFQFAMGDGNGVIVTGAFCVGQFVLCAAQGLVSVQHIVHGRLCQGRHFLGHHGQTPVIGTIQVAAVALQFAHDKLEQRTLAGTVAAHQPHPPAFVQHKTGLLQQEVRAAAQVDLFQRKHGGSVNNEKPAQCKPANRMGEPWTIP